MPSSSVVRRVGACVSVSSATSDLQVSEISLGSWLTYSGGVEADATAACTRAAFDAGITFFDTANVYGRGAAETAWGEILADYRRDEYVLATKVYFPMSDTDSGLSPDQIAKQIDASLQRLRTDHVDLYQCHRFDARVPIEDTMEALADVVRAGKARYLGFSEWTPDQIRAGLEAAPVRRDAGVVAAAVLDALARARARGVRPDPGARHLPRRLVAAGRGRAHRQVPPGRGGPRRLPRRQPDEMSGFIKQKLTDATLDGRRSASPRSPTGAGLSMAELALAWVLRRPELASAIIGASRPEQVHANAAAAGIELTPDTLTAIDEALGDVPTKGVRPRARCVGRHHAPVVARRAPSSGCQRWHFADAGRQGSAIVVGPPGRTAVAAMAHR